MFFKDNPSFNMLTLIDLIAIDYPNDEINYSHQQRAEGLIDGIETIKYENERAD